ncbi:YbcC family protein [Thiobacter aerophilum]|uniref:Probable inorganic carbon transporter subunit DabA n=1 Tax=Thiobacter aerophilum TaxID=3121275 RepID=A0ABV0EGJ6_9BURK
MNPNDAPLTEQSTAELDRLLDAACDRIAPLWPLNHFVAVNPFFGLRDLTFQEASDLLARLTGRGLYMPRAYFREQLANGRIAHEDIAAAIARAGSAATVDDVTQALAREAPRPKLGMASVAEILDRMENGIWAAFVTERISLHCAAYFDLGQALVTMPWRKASLYASWRKAARIDLSPAMMGLHGFRRRVAQLPEDPRSVIDWALAELEIQEAAKERYLHAALLSVGGWAAWTRYLRWQAELAGQRDDSMTDLLAIRLAWDALLYQEKHSPTLVAHWREMLAASMRPPSAKRQAAAEIDRILLNALEIGVQRELASGFARAPGAGACARPKLQAAFCIDVRSEVFRRALETVAPEVQTIGFAGFFGIFVAHLPLGAAQARSHVPVIFTPRYCIHDRARDGASTPLIASRRRRMGREKAWKGFKLSAASCFSFVEAVGLKYAAKLLTDSFGWTRPVPDPHRAGLRPREAARIAPTIEMVREEHACALPAGIPPAARVAEAERILRALSLTDTFARLVLLAGHGSTTVNNPHATALDCGACAGQTGEVSARVVAALLNDPAVREGLKARGITIPADTWFVPALHDTTTDEVHLFDTDCLPASHGPDLLALRQWLMQAGDLARMERAGMLGLGHLPDQRVATAVRDRSRDWSQVRPEWALANNAAFIAAPRWRTAGMDLGGRAFLHEYVWHKDEGFKILELIMTAPMVVANWINMQYYGSVLDNRRFGSGNKVLHNVVGGAIGVLEGNGGDLRVGLPLQSVHDGRRWVHEPVRLSVFIEAPEAAMDDIIARHDLVRQLVENQWLHLFAIDAEGRVTRRVSAGRWEAFA